MSAELSSMYPLHRTDENGHLDIAKLFMDARQERHECDTNELSRRKQQAGFCEASPKMTVS